MIVTVLTEARNMVRPAYPAQRFKRAKLAIQKISAPRNVICLRRSFGSIAGLAFEQLNLPGSM